MFQSYEDISDPARAGPRVARLREELAREGLDGFLVPRADAHLGEYVPPCAERLFWLTGFSGSAGLAVVLRDKAALFVDGRYTLQVRAQVDMDLFEACQVPGTKPADWLVKKARKGARIGYDPRLHAMRQIETEKQVLEREGITLVPVVDNLVDRIWLDQPAPPAGAVFLHGEKFAGKSAADKLGEVRAALQEAGQEACVLAAADSVSWLFNLRAWDVAHTPSVLAFAIVYGHKKPELFLAAGRLSADVRAALEPVVRLLAPETLPDRLAALGEAGAVVRLDPATTPQWFADRLTQAGARIVRGSDPCVLPKAIKNATEIAGARAAHLRDGIAMTRFLHWLDSKTAQCRAGEDSGIDEIAAAQRLEAFRGESGCLQEISFDTISGAGANGAIVHYRVSEKSNAPLLGGSLYLVDSGAQYVDGTTDITRTVPVGPVEGQMRRHFTLVLKGHIAIARARFPQGTRGCDLDPLARIALWQAGLDYDHGTGHGVGAYLSVHEGPQSLSRRGMHVLHPGMILSNEPGYYRTGAYGIRIENLLLVLEAREIAGGERKMLGFETLSLAPIDRRLVDADLLDWQERQWLDAYHVRVREKLLPHLEGATAEWLEKMTQPL